MGRAARGLESGERCFHLGAKPIVAFAIERQPVVRHRQIDLRVVSGDPHAVQSGERLDVIADSRYGDATRFWHIADANTELDSRTLTDTVGESILVPRT